MRWCETWRGYRCGADIAGFSDHGAIQYRQGALDCTPKQRNRWDVRRRFAGQKESRGIAASALMGQLTKAWRHDAQSPSRHWRRRRRHRQEIVPSADLQGTWGLACCPFAAIGSRR